MDLRSIPGQPFQEILIGTSQSTVINDHRPSGNIMPTIEFFHLQRNKLNTINKVLITILLTYLGKKTSFTLSTKIKSVF